MLENRNCDIEIDSHSDARTLVHSVISLWWALSNNCHW